MNLEYGDPDTSPVGEGGIGMESTDVNDLAGRGQGELGEEALELSFGRLLPLPPAGLNSRKSVNDETRQGTEIIKLATRTIKE